MVQVVINLDTEDYTSPASDDSIIALAEIMRSEGVRGSFNIVAQLAVALVERGRQDVIDALKHHEINYHGNKHSWHPTHTEYTDTENWQAGYDRFMAEESSGIDIVKRVFGVDMLHASVTPGSVVSAQAIHGYVELGIPMCIASIVFNDESGGARWYCNALDIEFNGYLDSLLLHEGIQGVRNRLEEWSRLERLVLCIHPNIINHTRFWDEVNMKGENLVNWGEWIIPESRPSWQIRRFFDDFREFIRMLKRHGSFEFVTYESIWLEKKRQVKRVVTRQSLLDMLNQTSRSFFHCETDGTSYSLADLFWAAVHFLNEPNEAYAAERSIGPVFEPLGVVGRTEVAASEVMEAAMRLQGERIVPHSIDVGGKLLGPRDFMEAALQVLEGQSVAVVSPKPQMPDTYRCYGMESLSLAGEWLFPDSFKDEWVSNRLNWQSWTIRSDI